LRAAVTCWEIGSLWTPTGTVSSWAYTIFSAWKEPAYSDRRDEQERHDEGLLLGRTGVTSAVG